MSNVPGWSSKEWCHNRGLELTLEAEVKGKGKKELLGLSESYSPGNVKKKKKKIAIHIAEHWYKRTKE